MTLPPEILTELGGPGKFDMETDQKADFGLDAISE